MQNDFKEWLTKKMSSGPESKAKLIQGLKSHRNNVVTWITDNLPDWGTTACMELGTAVFSYSSNRDAEEFVTHLETVFASEIAAAG